ncbi:alpha/beta fold hydrolase [Halomicrobium mukohataei]|uniref:Alpha/beta fold hydrolase n=1 Tax=Halomicrobium mukohataei TaxID=57705 RepID=A0A847UBA5_9EURY|nr:alpha/beta fold hydrolase [Halomicrobium mukohataei]NLV09517.1 alpha/beta fold hydrolase [Halomicrobium mukohataei]
MTRKTTILFIALLLVFGGGTVAYLVQTDGGSVDTRDVRFAAPDGQMIHGTLYVPPGASADDPSPGVVATHGYINTRETQSPFAIEFARRGFVVLAIDQAGHGHSDPPAFGNGFGGPPALSYMRSLAFVDDDNVGLEGHSMGGWASVAAAQSDRDGYESVALVGSSTGNSGVAEGNATFPRNTAVVFSEYDEFSMLMWGVPHASNVERSEKLQTLFGTDEPVEEGRTYGSLEDGTARRLYTPATTHPGDHLSTTAVGDAVEWMQVTLDGEDELPPGNQIWWLKELGTLASLLGGVLFLFPFGAMVLSDRRFSELRRTVPEPAGVEGRSWYGAVAVAALVPVVTYFPLNLVGQGFVPINWLFPQQVTNGVMVWALGNGLIVAGLVGAWHYRSDRDSLARYGFDTDGWRTVARSAVAAATIVSGFLGTLGAVGYLFGTDFRFWVFAMKLPTPTQFRIALVYLVPLTLFFLALELLLHGQLRTGDRSFREALAHNWIAVVGGFVLLLAVQYGVLLTGSPLPVVQPLLTVLAFQFVALLSIVTAVSTYFFRRTGRVWVGAFVNSLLVALVLVAGTATHAPL